MFNSLKLRTQLGLSSFFILALLIIISSISYVELSAGYDNFTHYRGLARDSNLAGRIQANLLSVRLSSSKYINEQSDENEKNFIERFTLLENLIEQTKTSIVDPVVAEKFQQSDNEIRQYKQSFFAVKALIHKRNQLVKNQLDPNGAAMKERITRIIASAHSDNDNTAAYIASRLAERMMSGRLFVTKFLVTNADYDFQRGKQELVALSENIRELDAALENPARRRLLEEFKQHYARYQKAFDEVAQLIQDRNALIENSLNIIGPRVASILEDLKLGIKDKQDTLGPIAQSQAESAKMVVVFISVCAVFLGFFLSLYVTRVIQKPIGGEPKEMEKIAQTVSHGDLSLQFTDTGKETGIYAAMSVMVSGLRQLISSISGSTEKLREASDYLTATTTETASSSESQMFQLDQTATAMHQMSATVNEIATNAQQASSAACQAEKYANEGMVMVNDTSDSINLLVGNIHDVSATIENLEKETESVGSILDVIRGIADQTNLLALNAAIEAARAGEQGRGFAVVADEVRSLASRTQESTDEIQAMISRLQSEAKVSVQSMQSNVQEAQLTADKAAKTGDALLSITESITAIRDMNAQIATASEEQSVVTSQINSSVEEINELAKKTSSDAVNTSSSASELLKMADSLNQVVERFKL